QSMVRRGYLVAPGGSASMVPPVLRALEPGVHELEQQGVVALVQDGPEGRLYLTYPKSRIERIGLMLAIGPIVLALLAVLFSAWLTYRMATRLLAPMGWLAGEVRSWDPRNPDLSSLAADRLPPDADIE